LLASEVPWHWWVYSKSNTPYLQTESRVQKIVGNLVKRIYSKSLDKIQMFEIIRYIQFNGQKYTSTEFRNRWIQCKSQKPLVYTGQRPETSDAQYRGQKS
jgi:hypothetical protein